MSHATDNCSRVREGRFPDSCRRANGILAGDLFRDSGVVVPLTRLDPIRNGFVQRRIAGLIFDLRTSALGMPSDEDAKHDQEAGQGKDD